MKYKLVKKTQKEHKCVLCGDVIKESSLAVRAHKNRWVQFIYCKDCGKEFIVDEYEIAKKNFDMIKNYFSTDKRSFYQLFKTELDKYTEYINLLE